MVTGIRHKAVLVLGCLLVAVVMACGGGPSEAESEATVEARVELAKASLVAPTAAPLPTYTPMPTYTPAPAPAPEVVVKEVIVEKPVEVVVEKEVVKEIIVEKIVEVVVTAAPLPTYTPLPTLTPQVIIKEVVVTATPTPTPHPGYRLFINGRAVQFGFTTIGVGNGFLHVDQPTDYYANTYTRGSIVTVMVNPTVPGSTVTWTGVDTQSRKSATVRMTSDQYVNVDIALPPPTPTPTPVLRCHPPGAGGRSPGWRRRQATGPGLPGIPG